MESRDGAAGDRDEREGEELAGEHRALARRCERGQGRHAERRQEDEDRDGERHDRGDLQERREIIAGTEQHPHRQHRGDEPVGDHHPRERRARVGEGGRDRGVIRHPAAPDEGGEEQRGPHRRGLAHLARPPALHPPPHQQGDRHRAGDGEEAPRRGAERVHHDQRQHGEQDDHDREHRDHRRHARDPADFLFRHLAQGLAVAPQRAEQNREILHRASQHHADHEPERARQKAELRGEHRPHERARSGDRGEVVAEQHPAVGRDEVVAVVEALGGRGAARIEAEYRVRQELGVEPEADSVGADRRNEQPCRADRLAAGEGEHAERRRAEQRDRAPYQDRRGPGHGR